MGELIEIGFVMWIIGVAAFAPLGYFLYIFTVGNGQSFGKSDPSDHHVEETGYYKFIDMVMRTLLGGTGNNIPAVETKPSVSATVGNTDNSGRKPRTISATAAARSASTGESSAKKPKKAADKKSSKSASKKETKSKKNKSAKKNASKSK